MKSTQRLQELGQSLWLDNITCGLLTDGTFRRYIAEGLDRRKECERVVAAVRRDGVRGVGCIVLGRGADEEKVAGWLETAATVPGYIGFAVGRTTFWEPVANYLAHVTTRQEAVSRIARRYRAWAAIFERARSVAD